MGKWPQVRKSLRGDKKGRVDRCHYTNSCWPWFQLCVSTRWYLCDSRGKYNPGISYCSPATSRISQHKVGTGGSPRRPHFLCSLVWGWSNKKSCVSLQESREDDLSITIIWVATRWLRRQLRPRRTRNRTSRSGYELPLCGAIITIARRHAVWAIYKRCIALHQGLARFANDCKDNFTSRAAV